MNFGQALLFLVVLSWVVRLWMTFPNYVIYLCVGLLFFAWWYMNHPPTVVFFSPLPIWEKVMSVLIYAHLWPVDLAISLFRFFILKQSFEEI